jgi:hypothetical protein
MTSESVADFASEHAVDIIGIGIGATSRAGFWPPSVAWHGRSPYTT